MKPYARERAFLASLENSPALGQANSTPHEASYGHADAPAVPALSMPVKRCAPVSPNKITLVHARLTSAMWAQQVYALTHIMRPHHGRGGSMGASSALKWRRAAGWRTMR